MEDKYDESYRGLEDPTTDDAHDRGLGKFGTGKRQL